MKNSAYANLLVIVSLVTLMGTTGLADHEHADSEPVRIEILVRELTIEVHLLNRSKGVLRTLVAYPAFYKLTLFTHKMEKIACRDGRDPLPNAGAPFLFDEKTLKSSDFKPFQAGEKREVFEGRFEKKANRYSFRGGFYLCDGLLPGRYFLQVTWWNSWDHYFDQNEDEMKPVNAAWKGHVVSEKKRSFCHSGLLKAPMLEFENKSRAQ